MLHQPQTLFWNSFALSADDLPSDSAVLSTHQQAVTELLVRGSLNQGVAQRHVSSNEEELFKNVIDDCLQQPSDLQLNKFYSFILAQPLCWIELVSV